MLEKLELWSFILTLLINHVVGDTRKSTDRFSLEASIKLAPLFFCAAIDWTSFTSGPFCVYENRPVCVADGNVGQRRAWWHHGSVDISALPPPVPPQSFFLSSTCKGCKSVQLQVEASPRLQRDLNYLSIHREQTEECVLSKGRCCAGVSSC